jgi:hypothetical protein
MRFRAAAFVLLLAVGRAAAQGEAWDSGRIYVPASLSASGEPCAGQIGGKCMERIAAGRHPVILFLHGCDGIRRPKALLDLDAIVVEPDSFWQGERCSLNVAEMAKLLAARMQDVAAAVHALLAAAWADPTRLVLAGYSQGGIAAALYEGPEFKARIVIAWPCQIRASGPAGRETGVRGEGPVLAIQSRDDALYKRLGIEGDCGPEISERPGSRALLLAGSAHRVLDDPKTREAIAAFVPEVLR